MPASKKKKTAASTSLERSAALLKREIAIMARRRDVIRGYISDFEELAESCDQAHDELQVALDAINSAVDKLSELV